MRKNITIKVYDSSGNFIKVWDDAKFVGFSKSINGGLGECSIELAREWDNYGEKYDVKLHNEVQILITDKDTIGTYDKYKLVYSGYISRYVPWVEGGREGVIITLLGYYTKLAQDIYKNGTTTTITEAATDVGTMFKNLMDRYIAETSNPKLHYSSENIRETSTTAGYTFEMMTYQGAIDVIKNLAPADWWWYVNAHNEVIFKSKPSSATHTFVFGRHFRKVVVEKSMEKIKNVYLFWNTKTDASQIYKHYDDDGAASINDYGRRVERKIDQDRVAASADADKMAAYFIAKHKDPDIKVVVEIIDNNEHDDFGYDIESIDPGDTCNFIGFDESLNETFKENMLITRVDYTLSEATITIEPMSAGLVDVSEQALKGLIEINTKGTPTDYTDD